MKKIILENGNDTTDGLLIPCDNDTIKFHDWIDNEKDWSRDGSDFYKYDVTFGKITIKYKELYNIFINLKIK